MSLADKWVSLAVKTAILADKHPNLADKLLFLADKFKSTFIFQKNSKGYGMSCSFFHLNREDSALSAAFLQYLRKISG